MAIRLGIIGYGGMAGWHAQNCIKIPDVRVEAVYDIDPERVKLGIEHGYKGYDTLDAFLADDQINTVLVATPNDFHAELCIAALNAGKHTICEKPVALNTKELDAVLAASEKNGKLFTVHQNRRWDKDFMTAKKVLESGDLGKVFTIQSRLHGCGGVMHGWRGEVKHGGGMLYDWGVHFLDQMLYMCGYDTFKNVRCVLSSVKNEEIDDYFNILLDSGDGYRAIIEIGTYILDELPRWLVCGDEATLTINDFSATGKITKVNTLMEDVPVIVMTSSGPTRTFAPRPKEVKSEFPLPEVTGEWTEYYKNVDLAIQGKAELIVKPCQVRKVLSVIEACFESAKTGQTISIA